MGEGKTIWNLTALLTANVQDYLAKMDQAKKKAGMFGDAMNELKSTVMGALSVGAIIAFSKASVDAYVEASKYETMLANALRGRSAEQERLLASAKRIAATTLFDDDQIIKQQAFLASLGKTEEQINDIINASIQYSTVSRQDFDSVVKMLTGTLAGQTKGIGNLIPELQSMTAEQLKHGDAVKYVLDRYQGYAEGAANSPAGAINQMAKAWNELKESFGGFIANNKFVQEQISGWTKIFYILGSGDKTTWGEKLHAFWGDTDPAEIDKIYQKVIAGNQGAEASQSKWNTEWDKWLNTMPGAAAGIDNLKGKVTGFFDYVQKEAPIALESWMNGMEGVSTGDWLGGVQQDENVMLEPWMQGKSVIDSGPWLHAKDNSPISIAGDLGSEDMQKVEDKWTAQIKEMNDALSSGIADLGVTVATGLGKVFSGEITMNKSFFLPILQAFGEFLQRMGTLIMGYGVAMDAFKKAFKNPYAAIAAGAALIVIGSAISSAASKGLSGSRGAGVVPSSSLSSGYSSAASYEKGMQVLTVQVDGKMRGDYLYLTGKKAEKMIAYR